MNPGTALPGGSFKEEMESFKRTGGRNWFDEFKKIKGVQPLISQYSVDSICRILREVELGENKCRDEKALRKIKIKITRFRKEAEKAWQYSSGCSTDNSRRNKELSNLVTEVLKGEE